MNYERQKSYIRWYYERYRPSIGKITEKLLEKWVQKTDIHKLINELGLNELENIIIHDKIVLYAQQGKTKKWVTNSLTRKKFQKDLIEKYLQELDELFNDWKLQQIHIEWIIGRLIRKNKSKKYIYQTLYPYKQLIEKYTPIVEQLYNEKQQEILQNEYQKLSKYPKEKIIQKLLQKGFHYGEIKEFLAK